MISYGGSFAFALHHSSTGSTLFVLMRCCLQDLEAENNEHVNQTVEQELRNSEEELDAEWK